MKLRVKQTFGVHAGRVLEFDQEIIRFGRLPESDVAFDPKVDLDASGRHAEIRTTSDGLTLFDLGSRNGTFLNGDNIRQAVISDGDEVEFGIGGPRVTVEVITDDVDAPTGSVQDDELGVENQRISEDGVTLHRASDSERTHALQGATGVIAEDRATLLTAGLTEHRARGTQHIPVWRNPRVIGLVVLLVCLLFAVLLFSRVVFPARSATRSVSLAPARVQTQVSSTQIERDHAGAVYGLMEHTKDMEVRLVCTAFAVHSDLLATAAHCLTSMEQAGAQGSTFQVRSCDEEQARAAAIVRMWRHPEFSNEGVRPTANIGVVQVDRKLPSVVRIASRENMAALASQEALYLFAAGSVGDQIRARVYGTKLQKLAEATGPADRNGARTLNYHAVLPPSAGGCPVFDTRGHVVGVHVASLGMLATGMPSAARPTEGYTYAVQVDSLSELLLGLGR